MSTPYSIGRARQRVLAGCLRRAFPRARASYAEQARFIVTFAVGLGRDNDAFPVSFTRAFGADPVWTAERVPAQLTEHMSVTFQLPPDFVAGLAPLPDSVVDHAQVYFGNGRQRSVARYVRGAVQLSAQANDGVTPNAIALARAIGAELAVVNAGQGKPGAAVYDRVVWGGDGPPPGADAANSPAPPAGPRSG